MTRKGTYILTAIAAILFVFLNWAFADGLFSLKNFWTSEVYSESTIFTYVLLALIVGAGVLQARRMPDAGIDTTMAKVSSDAGQTDDPRIWKLLMGNAYWAIIWLPIRFFVGREWLAAGEHKMRDDAWMSTGAALKGYWSGATAIPEQGSPRITYGWFREFLTYILNHEWYTWFAKVIAVGEFLIGVGLILGALVGIAAFFGTLMNFNFMLAGTASTNPVLFGASVFLILGWKVAGYWGIDRYLLPTLGTPWSFGTLGKGITTMEPETKVRPEAKGDHAPA